MIGLDRAHREIHVSASTDAEGNEITPPRSIPYDALVSPRECRREMTSQLQLPQAY
jgi:hypothetical protein